MHLDMFFALAMRIAAAAAAVAAAGELSIGTASRILVVGFRLCDFARSCKWIDAGADRSSGKHCRLVQRGRSCNGLHCS